MYYFVLLFVYYFVLLSVYNFVLLFVYYFVLLSVYYFVLLSVFDFINIGLFVSMAICRCFMESIRTIAIINSWFFLFDVWLNLSMFLANRFK